MRVATFSSESAEVKVVAPTRNSAAEFDLCRSQDYCFPTLPASKIRSADRATAQREISTPRAALPALAETLGGGIGRAAPEPWPARVACVEDPARQRLSLSQGGCRRIRPAVVLARSAHARVRPVSAVHVTASMPSPDQVPVKSTHSTMRWPRWVVLIAGSTGSALRVFAFSAQ